MKFHLRNGLATLLLLSSVGIAAAAGTSAVASDNLKLTSTQEHSVWQSVSKANTSMKAPSGFTASIGAIVPSAVKLHALPSDVISQVPALRPYEYSMLDNQQILIVNPTDKKVVDIIKG